MLFVWSSYQVPCTHTAPTRQNFSMQQFSEYRVGPALICAHFLQHLCSYNSAHFMRGDVDMERSVTFLQSPAAVAGLWISCHGWNHFLCKEALVGCVHVSFRSVSSWWLTDSPLLTTGCRTLSCVSQRPGQETVGVQTHGAQDREASALPIGSPPQAPSKPPLPKIMPGSTDEHEDCQWAPCCPGRRAWRGVTGMPWSPPLPARSRRQPLSESVQGMERPGGWISAQRTSACLLSDHLSVLPAGSELSLVGPRRGRGQGRPPATEWSRVRGLLVWLASGSPGGFTDPRGGEKSREDVHPGRQPWPQASCALGPTAGNGRLSGHRAALPTPRPQLFL